MARSTRAQLVSWAASGGCLLQMGVTQADVLHFADDIVARDYPRSVMEIDDRWQAGYGECDWDYTKFPDKSRYELGNKKKELDITVFNLGKNEGWILEGEKETRDAKPEEMDSFKNAVKHSIDMIFRFRYKDPGNKLFYMGAGEGKEVMLEIVKLVDPENDEVLLYFDRLSKLPAKIEYRDINDRGVRQRHVEEFSQWFMKQGVNTPLRVDGYINGRRLSQHFLLKVTYNNNLPDSFFSKPVFLK